MYGNAPFAGDAESSHTLTAAERRRLRQDLANVAARTRELLPDEYAVGLELSQNADGPRATVAVQPPVGAMVSAGYNPPDDATVEIGDDERAELAQGLAASAALQVKQVLGGDGMPPAQ